MSSRRSVLINDFTCNRYCPSLTTLIFTVLLIHGSLGQDIAFPDDNSTIIRPQIHSETSTSRPNNEPFSTTVPTLLKCGENMVSVQLGETETDCECLQGYLYHLETDRCYKPYTRGPCDDGSHFILRANKMVAECVRNPCKTNDEVLFKGSCHGLLLSSGPCASYETLVISETTHEPICRLIDTALYQLIDVPSIPCGPGSKRDAEGKCRQEV